MYLKTSICLSRIFLYWPKRWLLIKSPVQKVQQSNVLRNLKSKDRAYTVDFAIKEVYLAFQSHRIVYHVEDRSDGIKTRELILKDISREKTILSKAIKFGKDNPTQSTELHGQDAASD